MYCIKIDQKTFNKMNKNERVLDAIVGSVMYKTVTKNSDMDCVRVVKDNKDMKSGEVYLYNHFDTVDHIIVDESTFLKKAKDGSDLVLFEAYYSNSGEDFNLSKVVRAYTGVSHRDLLETQKEGKTDEFAEKKLYHALRCHFIAKELLLTGHIDFKGCAQDAKDFTNDIEQEVLDKFVNSIIRFRDVLKAK